MDIAKKIINFAIAILAIVACVQIITVNKNSLFSSREDGMKEYRTKIVSKLDREKTHLAYVAENEDPVSRM